MLWTVGVFEMICSGMLSVLVMASALPVLCR
jgi:hypothetical protein